MSKHSNKLQKWISKNEQEHIEHVIGRIERQYPFEVVVAFTDEPAVVPFAAARMIALLAIAAELVATALWWPVPAWALGLCVFAFLLAPTGRWQSLWIFRVLSRAAEKQSAVESQSEICFSDLGLARSKKRNALLLFFNLKERIFCLKPDRTLESEWPDLKIDELVSDLQLNLEKTKSPDTAAAQLLERLFHLATLRWPDALEQHTKPNELPDALTWWNTK